MGGFVLELQRQRPAVAADQPDGHRDHVRQLARLPRRGQAVLLEAEGVGARVRVVAAARGDVRRAGLRVPAFEGVEPGRQRAAGVGVGDGLCEVVAGHGLAVVALEVQRHAAREAVAADQRLHHPRHLGALFVDRGGVEVVDLDVLIGPHRVCHRARVLRELRRTQALHIADALDGAGRGRAGHVHRELLIAEDRQALLQRQLEPVAAGDAVAGPVVEVLVADDALDADVVVVGGRRRAGQHELGVEDVQPLVLHRAHVEVADRDDHETLEIQRQRKARLVPDDGRHQRIHRVFGLAEVLALDVHLEQVLPAAARADLLAPHRQVAGHQREQVARLGERVVPLGEVAAAVQIALLDEVAVGQQHWDTAPCRRAA